MNMIQIYLRSIHSHEETDEVGADEPYVLVTAVNLSSSVRVSGFPFPLPAFEVVRYGFNDVDDEETHTAPGASQSFWGINGQPDNLTDPNNAIFIISLMENDDGDPEALRGIVKGVVGGSILGSLTLNRAGKVAALIRDVNSAMGTPTGAPSFDDKIGLLELRFSADELRRAEAGEAVQQSINIDGDGGRFELVFEARNLQASRWSGVGDNWRSLGGIFPVGAPVTAVSRNPGQLDLFVCGNDGRVYTSWWSQGQDWSGVNDNWRSIGGFFPPGAKVAAVARTPDNLDLFICGNDGRVYTSWWSQGQDWSGVNDNWRSIGGFFPPGAPLSAVARTGNNLDLFICGNDGRVYTSWWFAGVDWSGVNDNWRSIGGIFPVGAPVAAVARTPDNLDLFICGNDGRVYTSWWFTGVDWSGVNDNWFPLGGFFPPGAPLGVAARTGNNLDLFICGNDGRIYSSWWSA
jgi:hypothetical protein